MRAMLFVLALASLLAFTYERSICAVQWPGDGTIVSFHGDQRQPHTARLPLLDGCRFVLEWHGEKAQLYAEANPLRDGWTDEGCATWYRVTLDSLERASRRVP